MSRRREISCGKAVPGQHLYHKYFSVSGVVLFTQITIHSQTGETYSFTDLPAKKLQGWMTQLGVQNMTIEIAEEYKASLVPFPKETLKPRNLPTETLEFLTETGLPLHAGYEITPNAPDII